MRCEHECRIFRSSADWSDVGSGTPEKSTASALALPAPFPLAPFLGWGAFSAAADAASSVTAALQTTGCTLHVLHACERGCQAREMLGT